MNVNDTEIARSILKNEGYQDSTDIHEVSEVFRGILDYTKLTFLFSRQMSYWLSLVPYVKMLSLKFGSDWIFLKALKRKDRAVFLH